MIRVQMKKWDAAKPEQKNILYRINQSQTVLFKEDHEVREKQKKTAQLEQSETVQLQYCLSGGQYGIYAREYRGQVTEKDGCKVADILACVVDEPGKMIFSTICDVKRNISAFSDDLQKDNAMLTAVKEVRDFIEQLRAGVLHKNSFMLYYHADDFQERERLGIVTKSFEPEKFRAVADLLEQRVQADDPKVSSLVTHKLRNNLGPYRGEIGKLRAFADQTVFIGGKPCPLHVFPLKQTGPSTLTAAIKLDAPSTAALVGSARGGGAAKGPALALSGAAGGTGH